MDVDVDDGLVARGLVRRGPSGEDRRRVLVELTAAGRTAAQAKLVEVRARRRRIAQAFDEDEQEQVVALLLRLAQAVEEL